MPSEFLPAFDYMMNNEDFHRFGVITDEPNGGKARFGINSIFHPKAVADGFYEMDKEVALSYAMRVYEAEYWDNKGFSVIQDQRVATKLFDMAVNMGNGGEIAILQETLSIPVTDKLDGLTQASLAKIGLDPTFLPKLVENVKAHYNAIYEKNQQKYEHIIKGWLARGERLPQ